MDIQKIKEFFMDFRTWVGIIIFIVAFGIGFSGWAKLPDKVKKVEEKTEQTDDKVEKVAQTLDKYLLKQEVLQESQEKREQLMLELIKQKKDK